MTESVPLPELAELRRWQQPVSDEPVVDSVLESIDITDEGEPMVGGATVLDELPPLDGEERRAESDGFFLFFLPGPNEPGLAVASSVADTLGFDDPHLRGHDRGHDPFGF
ncbi:hypothetical protein [Streptomyces sp. NPDC097610]|uniref:hypothetical protein n=1 Tax=Streptomyces sp. NPDC097610 TaxID=3157227 RepID=UPI00332D4A49